MPAWKKLDEGLLEVKLRIMGKMYRRTFAVTVLSASLLISTTIRASTESPAGSSYPGALIDFLSKSQISGVAVIDTRTRTRTTGKPGGNDGDRWSRLDYSSYNFFIDVDTGLLNDLISLRTGGYLSGDIYNDSLKNSETGEYLCNEISICKENDWGSGDGRFAKLTHATLSVKTGPASGVRFGLLQANENGVIGNVWSFVPGTYRGAEINLKTAEERIHFTYFFADQFTAPWIKDDNDYARALWSDTTWDWAHSLGMTAKVSDQLEVKLGYGQAKNVRYADEIDWDGGFVVSYHDKTNTSAVKAYAAYAFDERTSLALDFYGVRDRVQYEDFGYTVSLSLNTGFSRFSWLSELLYTSSSNDRDINQRMIYTFGITNGTHNLWWDALSDWNKSGELSWYNRLTFNKGDGWKFSLGAGYGTGGKSAADGAKGDWDYDKEYALNGTISYSVMSGRFEGTTVRLHGTRLEREEFSGAPKADETDVRLQLIVPFEF